jgi:hypothetical protein
MALSNAILALSPLLYVRQADGVDHSGNGNDLTPFNSPTAGASLDLSDPGDPSIALADGNNLWNPEHYTSLDLTGNVSLFFLFNATTVGGSSRDLVRKEHLYGATLNTDAKVHTFVRIGSVDHDLTGTTTITAGTTYSVGCSYDGSTLKLYVNGALDASVAVTGSIDVAGGASFTVGTTGLGGFLGLAGQVDEVALFHSVLAGTDFAALHALASTSTVVAPHYSGGSGNSDGSLSLGGAEGAVMGALFGGPTNAQRIAGLTDYRAIYLHAPAEAITGLTAWLETGSAQTDSSEGIGASPSNPAQVIANATTAPTSVTFSAPATQGAGISLGSVSAGQAKPLWIRRQLDADAAAGERDFEIGVAWTDAGSVARTTTISLSYVVVKPVTIYVNADSSARSDSWTRAVAGDDPASPFATVQAAALIAHSGDTVQVEPSTLGNANAADPFDPDVYDGVHHLRNVDGSDVLPLALNGGNEPISIVGHVVSGVRPALRQLAFRELDNWHFEGLQVGYDVGSGHDTNTIQVLHNCKDLTFADMLYTGGAHYCISGRGVLSWSDFTVYSPYEGNGNFLDGAGFHLLGVDTSTGLDHPVVFRFTDGLFDGIQGEDAIQAALGAPERDVHLEVTDCTFQNIAQAGGPTAPHTDCIQSTGATTITIARNRFINVSSPFIASDGVHGRITLLDNIVDGIGNGFHGQGCSAWVIVNNTILCPGIAIAIGDRANLFEPGFVQKLTIVNNVAGDLDVAAGAVIDNASVVTNNAFTRQPGAVTPWGTQLVGLPELGSSARLIAAGLDGNYELATDPVDSVGVGQGRTLAGLDLTTDELAILANDYLGRPFATPRDIGAFQSDDGTGVTGAARPPYVVDLTPAPNSTATLTASATARLLPVPGQTIDPDSVTASTARIADSSTSTPLPAVVTLAEPDEDGYQLVTIDAKASLSPLQEGTLWPRVLYVVTLAGIQDTEGSTIITTSWQFRAGGASGPAIDGPTHGLGGVRRWTGTEWHLSGS